jgi:spermidine/putrescine transport system ATP-binding protein
MTMADTVAVMNQGRIEQMGVPQALYELPTTVFVATFLGQSNLFTGKVSSSTSTTMTVDIAGAGVTVPLDRAQVHRGVVTLGVRPEKVTLHRSAPSESGRTVMGPGRVVDASFSGVSTQYLVNVPGCGEISVFAQNTSLGDQARTGDEVYVSWSPDHTFGLLDHPSAPGSKFVADTDTGSLAVAEREKLEAELEES